MKQPTVTLERCRDAAAVDRMLRHPVVRHRAWGPCLRAPSVAGLEEGAQWVAFTVRVDGRPCGGLLWDLLGDVPRGHSLLLPPCRGRAAVEAGRQAVAWARREGGWARLTVELHAASRAVRWWLGQLGFQPAGGDGFYTIELANEKG